MTKGVRLGVNAVVVDVRGRVLLGLRDRPPIWNLPGGSVEDGEAAWTAVVREVMEEFGVEVTVDRLTGIYDRAPDGDPVLVFRCTPRRGLPQPLEDTLRVGWFSPGELPADLHPYQPLRIADALRTDRATALRCQPGPSLRVLFPDNEP